VTVRWVSQRSLFTPAGRAWRDSESLDDWYLFQGRKLLGMVTPDPAGKGHRPYLHISGGRGDALPACDDLADARRAVEEAASVVDNVERTESDLTKSVESCLDGDPCEVEGCAETATHWVYPMQYRCAKHHAEWCAENGEKE